MQNIKTIIFDIDGTILDTRTFIIAATEHALSQYGFPVPSREEIASHVGRPFDEFYEILTDSKGDVKKLQEAHRGFQLQNFDLVELFPDVLETLTELKEKEYILVALSSRKGTTLRISLEKAEVMRFFDTVIASDDVISVKPDPEGVFKALKETGGSIDTTVIVGDTHHDIGAGKNAGIKTVRVLYGFHTDRLHDPEPDYFIQDIRELLDLLS